MSMSNATENDVFEMMTEQAKQPEDQQPVPSPVVADTSLQIDNLVLGVKAQLTKEQAHG